MREPRFDIDQVIGTQSELWVADFIKMLRAGNGAIEVKAPKPFLENQSAYIEFLCQSRTGKWYKSGIATTKAKLWVLTFGSLPGGLIIETEWLAEAARLAYRRDLIKDCRRGSNPTKAVVVSLRELWETRPGDP